MKFLMDANLPFRLAIILKDKGYDIIHTDDLPDKVPKNQLIQSNIHLFLIPSPQKFCTFDL
jgi:predicted nuclease of predicted toxin-antitoxin system